MMGSRLQKSFYCTGGAYGEHDFTTDKYALSTLTEGFRELTQSVRGPWRFWLHFHTQSPIRTVHLEWPR
jgi:hypothetical protein